MDNNLEIKSKFIKIDVIVFCSGVILIIFSLLAIKYELIPFDPTFLFLIIIYSMLFLEEFLTTRFFNVKFNIQYFLAGIFSFSIFFGLLFIFYLLNVWLAKFTIFFLVPLIILIIFTLKGKTLPEKIYKVRFEMLSRSLELRRITKEEIKFAMRIIISDRKLLIFLIFTVLIVIISLYFLFSTPFGILA